MLQITIPGFEWFDNRTQTFGNTKTATLQLEHSLMSLSKWESKWKKPFLATEQKTLEQCVDYIRCMTVTPNVDPLVYKGLREEHFQAINKYIEDSMTATWFSNKDEKRGGRDIITAEIIYYWMVSLNIPFECQKWHLNRLLTLIRVCNAKNAPKKKRNPSSFLSERKALNESRKKKLHTKG